VYKIAGVSNVTARFLPAVFGLLLIAFAWPLSRWIGKRAAVVFAVLVLISPHLAYFSRFIREDVYSLVFTLGTILAFRYFLETDRARWLTAAAVLFAFAGVTKENAYMTGVLFVAFGFWAFLEKVVTARPRGGAVASTLAATVAWVRRHLVPLLTAGLVFLFIWALMYSAFGRYPGDWLAIPKAVKYWMGQHTIARIRGPWYYYFPQLIYYETGFLVAALFAFRKKRNDPFFGFLVFWAVGSLAIYAWAREKVPWLTIHSLLPITILAAIGIADLWGDRIERRWKAALAIIGLLLAVNTGGMVLACFRYGAHDLEREPKHAEMLAYVQTTQDFVRALEPVERAKLRVPAGQAVITVAGEATWPLTWYLRDVATRWLGRIEDASTPIIVADWNAEGGLEKQLADRYNAKRVPIRAWWFPEGTRPTPSDLLHWWLDHRIWTPIGSQDAMFFVRKDLDEGSGPLEPLRVAVQDTSSRDYPSEAAVIPATREWGGPGAGRGQFMEPRGLAADARGNLYVADTKNSRIQVFDGNGQFVREFGSKGSGDGQFNEPCGVAVDPQGEIWVADTWNQRIVHFNPDGKYAGSFIDTEKGFFGPRAVIPSKNLLYVADTGNKRIVRFDRQGNRLSDWGGNGTRPGQFIEPVGLAADPTGNIYVADTGNHRVQVFDWEGKFLRQFPVSGWKDFYTEPYVAIGPSDSIFATDSVAGRLVQYDASGALKRSWKPDKDVKQPTGIALDAFGRLTVSDRGTHRLFVWNLGDVLR
ncbi:MAG TPA: flippase activity-associated protein Agl23, partial [Thermoanaerobaculia bacterium]|nr:flippase activity-associated protein Agl23 [Thermoanaerobaculia bacterium]